MNEKSPTPFTARKETKGYTDSDAPYWAILSSDARKLERPAQELADQILAINSGHPSLGPGFLANLKSLAQQIKDL